jgi:dephospho-CoA kinase
MAMVALTGNAAAGKSTVAGIWAAAGVPVVRADDLAREAVAPGSEGLAEVVAPSAPRSFRPTAPWIGGLSGTASSGTRESEPAWRRSFIPGSVPLRDRWMALRREGGAPLAVAEIPLLFEVGLQGDYDVVVCVDAPEELAPGTSREGPGTGGGGRTRIMSSQIPSPEKRRQVPLRPGQ